MKKIFVLFVVVFWLFFSFGLADGFLYPTTNTATNGQIIFSAGNLHLGIGAGIGKNFEFGYALSYSNLGTYLKFKPFKNIALGISYLPFKLCLFGFCEQISTLTTYGVYKIGNEDFNTNIGLRFSMINDLSKTNVDAFAIVQKKINGAFLIFEGGIEKNSSIQSPKFNLATGVSEKFGMLSFKAGLIWMDFKANEKSFMQPLPYLEMNLILNLWR